MIEFEFDQLKSKNNRIKHGISFTEAQELWSDPEFIRIEAKNIDEERYIAVGEIRGKVWTAVFTYRGDKIRIISVRRARIEEVALYES